MRLTVPAAALVFLAACGGGGSSAPGTTPTVPLKGAGQACSATSECQTSLVCQSGSCTAIAPAASCTNPGSSTATLVAGSVFDLGDPGPTACVSTVRSAQFGAASDLVVQDLGEHAVNDLVSFVVTPGTTSFSIVSQEVNGSAVDEVNIPGLGAVPNTVVPDKVTTGAGALYYDDNQSLDVFGQNLSAVYWGTSPVSGTFTAPNTTPGLDAVRSTGALPPGTWTFRANDWANECQTISGLCTTIPPNTNTGRYHLWSVTKNGPIASTGALDLDVYLLLDPTDKVGTTAAAAAGNAQVQRWVSSLAYFLANAGICLGTVTLHDLPAWVHTRYPNNSVDITGAGPCDPLQQLFTTSAAAPARGANLFLIHELVYTGPGTPGTTIVGIDGTIPGPSGFPGTIASGAAVGVFGEFGAGTCTGSTPSISTCGTDRVAYIAAHELGHWLGLYHTTESDGGSNSFDPLSDTPTCACSSCVTDSARRTQCGTANAEVDASDCTHTGSTCGGGDNLMFWLLDPTYSRGKLSRDQGQVMRLNPAVR
jgi:hypothetical protein